MQSAHTTPRPDPRSHDRAAIAAGLRDLADAIENGTHRAPARGIGGARQLGMPVVPVAVHDALCGWRIASEQTTYALGLLACAGCGMGYRLDEVRRLVDEHAQRAE